MADSRAFDVAHEHVCKWEGYWSDDPDDTGGATKYGVSLKFLRSTNTDINDDGTVDRNDVLAVTPEIQKTLFKHNFWDNLNLDGWPARVAIVFYDSSVNAGAKQSVKLLQRALNVSDDGLYGPETKAALMSCDDLATALRLCDERDKFYRSIAKNGNNAKFLRGWLNRVDACRSVVRGF